MKLVKTALAVATCFITVQAMAADGEINFTGNVKANTCSVSVTDVNGGGGAGTVNLGTVSTSSLSKAGDVAGSAAFTLSVSAPTEEGKAADCDLSALSANVRFMSANGAAGPSGQWIGLTGAGDENVAQNVAIQLRDSSGNDVQLGQVSTDYKDLNEPMRFTANYIATGAATAGSANAKATFSIEYK